MKIYSLLTGQPYEGEPVDCRELLLSGKYSETAPTEEDVAAANEDGDVVVRAAKPAAAHKKPAK